MMRSIRMLWGLMVSSFSSVTQCEGSRIKWEYFVADMGCRLAGLMVNATGEGTGMFGSPGWLHEVKGNLTFQDVRTTGVTPCVLTFGANISTQLATTEGVIRGDFAFFLPKSKLPSQLMTSQSIDQSPKVAAEFLVPMSAEAEKTVREAMAAANKENGEGSSEA